MYQLVNIEVGNDTYTVYILVRYKAMDKIFKSEMTRVATEDLSDLDICERAWPQVQSLIQKWTDQIDTGTYLIGKTFEPQEDGSLQFM